MAEPTPLLLSNIAHKFGNTAVLNALNLSVKAGEFVALLGPSGCGKTTLLRAIAGLVTPNAGTITIDGKVSRMTVLTTSRVKIVGLASYFKSTPSFQI